MEKRMTKSKLAIALALAFAANAALANGVPPAKPNPPKPDCTPGTAGSITKYCKDQHPTPTVPVNVNTNTATGGAATAGAVSQSTSAANAGAYGGYVAGVQAGNSLEINQRGAPYAPDVYAPATAPCRIAGGFSFGYIFGTGSVSGSIEDERCALQEMSRHLASTLELRAASVQVMCLDPRAKLALEATGTKCLISAQDLKKQ